VQAARFNGLMQEPTMPDNQPTPPDPAPPRPPYPEIDPASTPAEAPEPSTPDPDDGRPVDFA